MLGLALGLTFLSSQGKNPPTILLYSMGGFVGFATLLSAAYGLSQSRGSHQRHERRLNMPPPKVYVTKNGLYDEDKGYIPLSNLDAVQFVPSSTIRSYRGDWHILNHYPTPGFETQVDNVLQGRADEWAHFFFILVYRSRYTSGRWAYNVRVPPGQEAEAQALVARFQNERRLKDRPL